MIELGDALSKELSILPERSRVMVIGEPDTGKSTLVAVLARWFRSVSRKVAVVDSDIGQSLEARALCFTQPPSCFHVSES
ncbi:MAG TPA: hypothetical protein GX530_09775 [Corynebacteriales bacterium]|nr:hypothetical protein [Mycobacteriales bacterium]